MKASKIETMFIGIPVEWQSADLADIRRWLVGKIDNSDRAIVNVLGVRRMRYHAPSNPGWKMVKDWNWSKGGAVEVKYIRER